MSSETSENILNNSQEDCQAVLNDVLLRTQDADSSMTSSLHVPKNLGEDFDEVLAVDSDETPSRQPFAMKIAHFEEQAMASNRTNAAAAAAAAAAATTTTGVDEGTNASTEASTELRVFLRMRPTNEPSTIQVIPPTSKNSSEPYKIRTHAPSTSNAFKVSREGGLVKEYDFAYVFSAEETQSTVYQKTVQTYVRSVLTGQSALVFCYGITNAGKTYTMIGPEKETQPSEQPSVNPTSWGLVPRAVQELVSLVHNRQTKNMTLQLSYFEIYNERVCDLLPDTTDAKNRASAVQGVSAFEVSLHTISDLNEGLSLIAQARKNRRSGTNHINRGSSRSHAVCQLRVLHHEKAEADTSNKVSTNRHLSWQHSDLWIVDLAGSERSKRTGGVRQTEAATINKSLMTLNRCLTSLRARQEQGSQSVVIPWRESKLTHLFAAHWMGPYGGRTCMIVNVNSEASDFDETQHVLSYASVARTLQLKDSDTSKATAPAVPAIEYGYDGRRKQPPKNSMKQSVAHKVVQALRKLSPKRALDARNKRKNSDNDVDDTKLAPMAPQPAVKKMRVHGEKRVEKQSDETFRPMALVATAESAEIKEINKLKMALSMAQAELSILQNRAAEFEDQMESIESQVRNEVAEEMETQMHTMRQQYESMIANLKEHLQQSNESRSLGRGSDIQMAKAERKICDLLDQLNECETEILRHEQEMTAVKKQNEDLTQQVTAVKEQNENLTQQVVELKRQLQQPATDSEEYEAPTLSIDNDDTAISAGVDGSAPAEPNQMTSMHVQEEQEHQPEPYPEKQEDEEASPIANYASSTETGDDTPMEPRRMTRLQTQNESEHQLEPEKDDKDSLPPTSHPPSLPVSDEGTLTSPQQVTGLQVQNEVEDQLEPEKRGEGAPSSVTYASSTESDCSSPTETRRMTRRMTRVQVQKQAESDTESLLSQPSTAKKPRKPLGSLVNANSSTPAEVASDSYGSFGADQWHFPTQQLKKDPATGTFLRPRGRKPREADYWDGEKGAWRLM